MSRSCNSCLPWRLRSGSVTALFFKGHVDRLFAFKKSVRTGYFALGFNGKTVFCSREEVIGPPWCTLTEKERTKQACKKKEGNTHKLGCVCIA
jgi:hypothetical protein